MGLCVALEQVKGRQLQKLNNKTIDQCKCRGVLWQSQTLMIEESFEQLYIYNTQGVHWPKEQFLLNPTVFQNLLVYSKFMFLLWKYTN
jgi:hypothetical protein